MVNRMKPKISPRFDDMSREQQIAVSRVAATLAIEFDVDEMDALQWIVNAIDFRATTKAGVGCNRCGVIAFNCAYKKRQHDEIVHGASARLRRKRAERLASDADVYVKRSDDDARERVVERVPRSFPLGRAILRPYAGGDDPRRHKK